MHSSQHASDEPVDSVAFLDEWDEGRDSALVVGGSSEVSEGELLERVDLILKSHEVGDGLVSKERVVSALNLGREERQGRKQQLTLRLDRRFLEE